jgi:hypothetical protein
VHDDGADVMPGSRMALCGSGAQERPGEAAEGAVAPCGGISAGDPRPPAPAERLSGHEAGTGPDAGARHLLLPLPGELTFCQGCCVPGQFLLSAAHPV